MVFHMLKPLTKLGRSGLPSVDNTPERAEVLYRDAEAVLLEKAQSASREVEVESDPGRVSRRSFLWFPSRKAQRVTFIDAAT
ncbi:MAG: hypothetical protein M3Q87_01760 [Actinomycetota bacterium]|nr:hypothetical protein [Actinomycetota bacterium]